MTDEVLYFLLDLFFFSVVEGLLCSFMFEIFVRKNICVLRLIKNSGFVSVFIFVLSRILIYSPINQILICAFIIFYFYKFDNIPLHYSITLSTIFVSTIVILDVVLMIIYCKNSGIVNINIFDRFLIFIFSRLIYFLLLRGVSNMKILVGGITRR